MIVLRVPDDNDVHEEVEIAVIAETEHFALHRQPVYRGDGKWGYTRKFNEISTKAGIHVVTLPAAIDGEAFIDSAEYQLQGVPDHEVQSMSGRSWMNYVSDLQGMVYHASLEAGLNDTFVTEDNTDE